MKLRHLLLCAALPGCMNGCKPKDKPYYPITDQRLRDAVNIRQGSYFVYVDSITGTTDSFTVNGYSRLDYHDPSCDCTYEEIFYVAENTAPFPPGSISAGARTGYLTGDIRYLNGIFGGLHYAQLPFTAGQVSGTATLRYAHIAYHPSYTVLGRSYADVYEIETTGLNQGSTEYVLRSWYSMQSGLVRFTTSDSNGHHHWQLIRSDIRR